jgi:hypothetical protein
LDEILPLRDHACEFLSGRLIIAFAAPENIFIVEKKAIIVRPCAIRECVYEEITVFLATLWTHKLGLAWLVFRV